MPQEALVSIIDDDESVRAALGSLIRSLGYRVETYASADAFLDTGSPGTACVVTDIQMPGTNGIQLKQRLHGFVPDLPVIMMTARCEPELHERALACGALALLRKPFAVDALIECLERAIPAPQ